MHRFFLPTESFHGDTITFPPETSRQMTRVLRLTTDDQVAALDNSGKEYRVTLTALTSEVVTGTIISIHTPEIESPVHLHLLICLTQREKFEWLLQKGTEVGCAAFTPVISSRSLVQKADDWRQKQTRFEKIIREAAEQSRRARLPTLHPVCQLTEALAFFGEDTIKIILWEEEQSTTLHHVLSPLPSDSKVILLVGPEGGFSLQEVALARDHGYIPVSLGKRILRMETAALVGAALILHELENPIR